MQLRNKINKDKETKMEAHSKKTFLEMIEEANAQLLGEEGFVKGNQQPVTGKEKTALPPSGEDEVPEPEGEGEGEPEGAPAPEQSSEPNFTMREIDLMENAVMLYRGNTTRYSNDDRNELGRLFDAMEYKQVMQRLTAASDELKDAY
jgi:hypothetical protein